MNFYLKGKKLLTNNDISDLNPEISKIVDNQFDLNQDFAGFVSSYGKLPIHAPSGINKYAFYFQFGTPPNKIELAFDIDEKIFVRAKSGKTGKAVWDDWKQIGGVLRSILTHIRQDFTARKAVAC